jgi:hypothetical protein
MRKPSLAVERAMLAALEYAERYPKRWRDIGNEANRRRRHRAARWLLRRGFSPLDGNPLDDFHAMYFIPADNALAVSGWPELRSCQSRLSHSTART